MALDPSIILRAGQGQQQPRSMLQTYGNALAIRNAQDESAMRRNALAQQAAQREAIAGAYDPETGDMDPRRLRGALARSGDLKGLMDYEKSQASIGKNRAAGAKSEIERKKEVLSLMGRFLGGAKSPEQYAQNLQGLREFLGPQWNPPGELVPPPEQWTPEVSQRIGRLALSEKERLDQAWKEREFGLSERRTQAIEAGKTGTNVTFDTGNKAPQVGTIPQGYQLEELNGAWRMTPIPGGPAAAEAAAEEQREAMRRGQKDQAANLVLEDISRAKQLVMNNPQLTAGFLGNVLRDWAGTDAADVSALLDTIGANISFDKLNQMRAMSKTGGALGNVTERELELLSAVLGSVKQSQSPEQLIRNMQRLEQTFSEVVHGPQGRYGGPQFRPPTPTPGHVVNGYRFKGGDPADPGNWERL